MSATAPSIQAAPTANLAGDRTDEVVIGVSGLRKRYGELEAVRGIELQVRRGEIFAFLGPNGAGKTTTVEILEGFRGRSAGQVSVLGVDPAHADRHWRERRRRPAGLPARAGPARARMPAAVRRLLHPPPPAQGDDRPGRPPAAGRGAHRAASAAGWTSRWP